MFNYVLISSSLNWELTQKISTILQHFVQFIMALTENILKNIYIFLTLNIFVHLLY